LLKHAPLNLSGIFAAQAMSNAPFAAHYSPNHSRKNSRGINDITNRVQNIQVGEAR
jgi:hypothetical protein